LYDGLNVYALGNFAGAKAARTNVYSLGGAVDQSPHTLDVWIPTTLGSDMAVADAHAKGRLLAADFTNACHVQHTSGGHQAGN
jgi:hypothetical protein